MTTTPVIPGLLFLTVLQAFFIAAPMYRTLLPKQIVCFPLHPGALLI